MTRLGSKKWLVRIYENGRFIKEDITKCQHFGDKSKGNIKRFYPDDDNKYR